MQFNLDVNLIKTFRDKINSTNVFFTWSEYEPKWNLICAVMDRVDHTVSILNNKHRLNSGDIAHDTIIALVYVDILVKSIKELMTNLNVRYPLSTDATIFNKLGMGSGTDDRFFNYIRTLAFAHPVNATEHRSYIPVGEVKYCPYIMDSKDFGKKGDINVRVYSSADYSFVMENFTVSQLVQYTTKRYELLTVLHDRVDGIIQEYITHLRARKIVGATPIEVLQSVIGEAEYRKDEYLLGDFKNAYSILTTPLTNNKNAAAVGEFRISIESSISELASAYEKVDSIEIENCAFLKVLDFSYHDELSGYSYAYSKVKDHLSPNNAGRDTHFGFAMLNELREFTNQYVEIDDGMSLEEIQLLIDTAIYMFEKKYRSN